MQALTTLCEPVQEEQGALGIRGGPAGDEIIMHPLRRDTQDAGELRFFAIRPKQGTHRQDKGIPHWGLWSGTKGGSAATTGESGARPVGRPGESLGHSHQRVDQLEGLIQLRGDMHF